MKQLDCTVILRVHLPWFSPYFFSPVRDNCSVHVDPWMGQNAGNMYTCNSTIVCQFHDCVCFSRITYSRRYKASHGFVGVPTKLVIAVWGDDLALERAGATTGAIEDEDPGSAAVGCSRGFELQ